MTDIRHRPRKRFGQNFLIDRAVVDAIVAAIAPRREDRMVEIGPGTGALTRPLSERVHRLHVVEIDRDIVAQLRAGPLAPRIAIHEGDALEFDFASLGGDLRLVTDYRRLARRERSRPRHLRIVDYSAGSGVGRTHPGERLQSGGQIGGEAGRL